MLHHDQHVCKKFYLLPRQCPRCKDLALKFYIWRYGFRLCFGCVERGIQSGEFRKFPEPYEMRKKSLIADIKRLQKLRANRGGEEPK